MRTVNYSDVLQGSLALAGIPLAGFDPTQPEFALLRTMHDRRLRVAWEAHTWPDVCRYEQRSFRAPWNAATAYAAGAEVLDIPTLTYLQALQASTGQPPTTGGVVNTAYWAPCQAQYQAEPYAAGTNYAPGAVVLNPTDNLYYQCLAASGAILISGAGVASINGVYYPTGTNNGKPSYLKPDNSAAILWFSDLYQTGWVIAATNGAGGYYSTSATATPDQAAGWQPVDASLNAAPGNAPAPTVTASQAQPAPPGSTWGLLTPFQRTVAYQQYDVNGNALTPLGEVFSAWDRDPRVTTKTTKTPYTVTSDGFAFTTLRHVPAYVWLFYRLQRPTLTGAAWDATLVYASGQQIYFVDAQGNGNFWTCSATTTAGQSPTTAPSKWVVVALPYIFREYLVQGGYADWLTSDGQADKAAAMEGLAQQLLELEADKLQRQQQQVNRLQWQT